MMMMTTKNENETSTARMTRSSPSKSKTKTRDPLSSSTRHRAQRLRSSSTSSASWLSVFWICIVAFVPFGLFLSWHVGMGGSSSSRQAIWDATNDSSAVVAANKMVTEVLSNMKSQNSWWSDMPTNAILQHFLTSNGSNSSSSSTTTNLLSQPVQQQQPTIVPQTQQQQQEHAPPSYNPGQEKKKKLLALLYPPGLMGGYRNQVIRFISLCVYARENQERDLFLPSLLWVTQVQEQPISDDSSNTTTEQHNPWLPVPMQDIFDIEHWNSVASSQNDDDNNHNPLPRIIAVESKDIPTTIRNHAYTMSSSSASLVAAKSCWIYHDLHAELMMNNKSMHLYPHALQRAVWKRPGAGYLNGLYNETRAMIETFHRPASFIPRRADFLSVAQQHCPNTNSSRMMVYGGGKMGGRLWSDAMGRRKRLEKQLQQQASSSPQQKQKVDHMTALLQDQQQALITPTTMDGWVARALQPAPIWRTVADQCLVVMDDRNTNDNDGNKRHHDYLALHARIELEMMGHRCGATMEFNLTKILSQVQSLLDWTIPTSSQHGMVRPYGNVSGILIAVSREGMDPSKGGARFQDMAKDNLETLNHVVNRLPTRTGPEERLPPRVFECGEKLLRNYYAQHAEVPDYGSLLQSVVNFHLAVHAKIFVGVQRSSYSTDVWMTRYHLGKGRHNYRYTKNGFIVPVENGGLPKPHIDCATTSASEDAVNVMNLPIRH